MRAAPPVQYPDSGYFIGTSCTLGPKPPAGGTMGNDPVYGYERDTYLALSSSEQEIEDCLRGASPRATESP